MTKRKNLKIGIVGWNVGNTTFGINKAYLNHARYFAENVIILTPYCKFDPTLDLLILPGGKDVDPVRYGGIPYLWNSDPNSILEYFDKEILPHYIENKTPIFGVCRGFQSLNVTFNGALNQNWEHEQSTKSREELCHSLSLNLDNLQKNPRFYHVDLLNQFLTVNEKYLMKSIKVNSLHHQTVCDDTISDEFIPIAKHEDGAIEAMIHKTLPIAGVQYHAEEIFDSLSSYLITSLLT